MGSLVGAEWMTLAMVLREDDIIGEASEEESDDVWW
jgi:hypothetical protein